MELPRRLGPQADRSRLAKGKLTGALFVDIGLNPDGFGGDQGKDRIAGPDDGAGFGMAGDDGRVIGRLQPVMRQKRFLHYQRGSGVFALRLYDRQIGMGDGKVGAGDVFVTLRLFRPLGGGDILPGQRLLPVIRRHALCQNRLRPVQRRRGLGQARGAGGNGGTGAQYARFLFALMQDGKLLPLAHGIARVNVQRFKRRADLEAHARQDARLDRAKAVDAQRHIGFGADNAYLKRPFGQKQRPGTKGQDGNRAIDQGFPHGLILPCRKQVKLNIKQAQTLIPQGKPARAQGPADRDALHQRGQQHRNIRRQNVVP